MNIVSRHIHRKCHIYIQTRIPSDGLWCEILRNNRGNSILIYSTKKPIRVLCLRLNVLLLVRSGLHACLVQSVLSTIITVVPSRFVRASTPKNLPNQKHP